MLSAARCRARVASGCRRETASAPSYSLLNMDIALSLTSEQAILLLDLLSNVSCSDQLAAVKEQLQGAVGSQSHLSVAQQADHEELADTCECLDIVHDGVTLVH